MSELPVFLLAADPPLRTDTDAVAEAKAVAVAEAFAERHGGEFAGVLPQPERKPKRKRAAS